MATFTPGDSGFTTLTDNLEALYVGYFGTAADQQGLTFNANAINSGQFTFQQIEAFFTLQPATQARYPFLVSPSADPAVLDPFINSIYQDLYNHQADASGLAFWAGFVTKVLNGGFGPDHNFFLSQIIGFVINGTTGATDIATLQNKVSVAAFTTTTFNANGISSFTPTSAPGQESATQIATVTDSPATVTAAQAAITQFATTGTTTNVFLTTGVDNQTQGFAKDAAGTQPLNGFTALTNNNTFNGTVGGGGTWTPGDQVTAGAGTTGQSFNLVGTPATQGIIDITGVAGAKVLNIQTANISSAVNASGLPFQAFKGDFTAAGPQGEWTGLTALNVMSGGNSAGADNVTVGATAVTITDTLFADTTVPMILNGGTVDTITENNRTHDNAGIQVNGGSATTSVSITQTETGTSHDGAVTITDAGFATKAAGTITTVVLDGLTGDNEGNHIVNTINDNALANLTVAHSDSQIAESESSFLQGFNTSFRQFNGSNIPQFVGAELVINNNQATPTATSLNLTLTANGLDPDGDGTPDAALMIIDTNSEISTIHLTLGNQNSFTDFIFNGLTTLDTPNAGTGALTAFIEDSVAAAVNFDFSGLNGNNNIEVDRGSTLNNDIYTLGNFGTDNGYFSGDFFTHTQTFQIDNGIGANVATINFGSGAYIIGDPITHGTFNYVQTAANGAGLVSGLSATPTPLAQWAVIFNAKNGDTLHFTTDSVQNLADQGNVAFSTGISDSLMTAAHTASFFRDLAGNTFVFDHADNVATGITAADSLVEFGNIGFLGTTGHSTLAPGGIITLHG
jgi:hypothetical protein